MKQAAVLLTGAILASNVVGAAYYQDAYSQPYQGGHYQSDGYYQTQPGTIQGSYGADQSTYYSQPSPYFQHDSNYYRPETTGMQTSERIHRDAYKTNEDRELAQRIRQAIQNSGLRNSDLIVISVFDKRVILDGRVNSKEEAETAEEAAKNVSGVDNLENRLAAAFRDARDSFGRQTRTDTDSRFTNQTRFNNESTTQFGTATRDDDRILSRIQESLEQDPSNRFGAIVVRVNNGVVTLTGTVLSEQDRMDAKSKARRIDGVTDLRDQLQTSRTSQARTQPRSF